MDILASLPMHIVFMYTKVFAELSSTLFSDFLCMYLWVESKKHFLK